MPLLRVSTGGSSEIDSIRKQNGAIEIIEVSDASISTDCTVSYLRRLQGVWTRQSDLWADPYVD